MNIPHNYGTNLAHRLAAERGQTLSECRAEFDDSCIAFASEMVERFECGRLAYFDNISHPFWRFHAAFELDGVIHDLWEERALELSDYMKIALGARRVEYPAEPMLYCPVCRSFFNESLHACLDCAGELLTTANREE